jgi:hypothetical protein
MSALNFLIPGVRRVALDKKILNSIPLEAPPARLAHETDSARKTRNRALGAAESRGSRAARPAIVRNRTGP